jgi:hypothetical protein
VSEMQVRASAAARVLDRRALTPARARARRRRDRSRVREGAFGRRSRDPARYRRPLRRWPADREGAYAARRGLAKVQSNATAAPATGSVTATLSGASEDGSIGEWAVRTT